MTYPPTGQNPPQQPVPGQQPPLGYGAPGPFPGPGPAAAKKKSNVKLVLGIVGGLLGLCCVGGIVAAAVGGGDDSATDRTSSARNAVADEPAAAATSKAAPAKTTKAAPAKKPETPGLGDPVRDGKFQFTVSKVDCSKTEVGNSFLNQKAQGKYCQVSVTVKNIGKKAQYFDGSSQKALDRDGVEYSNDSGAEIYANEDSATFLNEVNPGNSVKGKLVFDVPKDVKLIKLELHDSLFSGGVEVALS